MNNTLATILLEAACETGREYALELMFKIMQPQVNATLARRMHRLASRKNNANLIRIICSRYRRLLII